MARIVSLRSPAADDVRALLGEEEEPAVATQRPVRPAFIALATAILLVGILIVTAVQELRASNDLRRLSPAIRADLYARTLAEVRGVCLEPAAGAGALRAHCIDEASFLARLPECTTACRSLVARVLPPPTR